MKRLIVLALMALLVLCAACESSVDSGGKAPVIPFLTPTAKPTPEPSPKPTPEPTDEPVEAPDPTDGPSEAHKALPDEIEITVTREGYDDVFTGTLTVSKHGYAIYLIDDFVLITEDDRDIIQLADVADPMFFMVITKIITMDEWRESENSALAGETAFNIEYVYTDEAAEGGAVMLKAMADTICAP